MTVRSESIRSCSWIPIFREDIRLAIVAFGPQTLALGGREFDDVILHLLHPGTLQRAVKTVKDAAEQAGRDPATVRCGPASRRWVTICPRVAAEEDRWRGWPPACGATATCW